ncbi:hypothetical protein T03_8548 [Trichinella britovi]|uniref:Retrovirus-related Pol polyprotein from transposon n=1 Tax=Trichinella britovi TaxID=45882 RepID=A0A0V1C672_TRIBR|nr:hypothetical protein T03_8548 [Trichinella britovi]
MQSLLAGNPRELIWEETTSAFFDYTEEALAKATIDSNYSGCIRCRHRCCAGTADQQQLATACLVQSETHRSRTEMQRFDRDLLALYLPIRHIWCYIEDRHFIAFADHT